MNISKIITLLLFTAFATVVKGDQLAYIDKNSAIKATEFLNNNKEAILFCGCCQGDVKKKISIYSAKYSRVPEVPNYYKVSISYEYNGDSMAGFEDIDLAYIHTENDGVWVSVGRALGMECDPCVEPFVFGDNTKTISMLDPNSVTCTEQESPNEEGGGPLLTKNCLYKNYKSITQGYPDYKGRYSYGYSIFKKEGNGNYVQIQNAMLFNGNKYELLSIINSKIKKDYTSFSNDPETKDCFEGASFTPYNFDQLGIDFNADGVNFNVTFGLSGSCMSVDGTIVSFNFDEINKYLNQ